MRYLALFILAACGSAATPNNLVPADGDEDGVETTDADGVAPQSLVLVSNGAAIGYVVGVDESTISLFDPVAGILFRVNDSTGYVTGWPKWYYAESGCDGALYMLDVSTFTGETCSALEPARRTVYGLDNDLAGWSQAGSLAVASGTRAWTHANATLDGGDCGNTPDVWGCGYVATAYTAIPTAFALPLEVVEAEPD